MRGRHEKRGGFFAGAARRSHATGVKFGQHNFRFRNFQIIRCPHQTETALQIHIDDAVADGVYVNMALVNHTDSEFTLDCIYVQPQQPKARVKSRIITSPRHMKRLVAAMVDNLQKYEAKYGVIDAGDPSLPVH